MIRREELGEYRSPRLWKKVSSPYLGAARGWAGGSLSGLPGGRRERCRVMRACAMACVYDDTTVTVPCRARPAWSRHSGSCHSRRSDGERELPCRSGVLRHRDEMLAGLLPSRPGSRARVCGVTVRRPARSLSCGAHPDIMDSRKLCCALRACPAFVLTRSGLRGWTNRGMARGRALWCSALHSEFPYGTHHRPRLLPVKSRA